MFQTAQRVDSFRTFAGSVIETQSGPDATEAVAIRYQQDVQALENRTRGAEYESDRVATNLMRSDEMVRFLHHYLTEQLWVAARQAGYVDQARHIVTGLHALIEGARSDDGDTLAIADIEHVMKDAATLCPPLPPSLLAFQAYRGPDKVGHFTSDDGALHMAYPLVGYSLMLRQSNEDLPRLEPTFLVDGQALPESTIRSEYGMGLRHL